MTPVASPGSHRALIYEQPTEYVSGIGDFLRSGLTNEERTVVMADRRKIEWLHEDLGAAASGVDFLDAAETVARRGRVARSLIERLGEGALSGGPLRVVTEEDLSVRPSHVVRDYLCMEAAANVAYGGLPISILCAYDASVAPVEVISACRSTHPETLRGGAVQESSEYRPPAEFIMASSAVVAPPSDAASLEIEAAVDLARARALLRSEAASASLPPEDVSDLVLAADEVLTNALVHGRAPRALHVYCERDALVCHVRDAGHGLDPLAAYLPPPEYALRGRGLWIARQTCDALEIASDPGGTHVRLMMLPARAEEAEPAGF